MRPIGTWLYSRVNLNLSDDPLLGPAAGAVHAEHGDTLPPSLLPAFRANSKLGNFCVEGSCDLLFASIFFATRSMITVRASNEMVISVVLKPENEGAEYEHNAAAVDESFDTRPTSGY